MPLARLAVMSPAAAVPDPATDTFAALRPRLFSIAYRMLGVRADAEDVLQDAWLRWRDADRAVLQSQEAWLVTVVTRLAIDRLRAARVEREAYVGSWLPEPLADVDPRTPEVAAELASEVSVAFLWVLERLAPEERAAFLLRQAFDRDYSEIAALLDKSEAACRQIVHRASERVREARPRFEVAADTHRRLLERFVHAARTGAREAMEALLAPDVQTLGDGGGKVAAAARGIVGAHRFANLLAVQKRKLGDRLEYRLATLNGEAGMLGFVDGAIASAYAFVTDGEHIVAVFSILNPDKLAAIGA
jgi:RNA polymerase sigma-70 factor (ECF subfamily)